VALCRRSFDDICDRIDWIIDYGRRRLYRGRYIDRRLFFACSFWSDGFLPTIYRFSATSSF